ncbi:MAG: regulatory protein RecX [Gammaproteobacteria bacterium]|nr:regulatory protein RecX [Gammaproteobacteria bacterium]MBV9619920.1 regulatory protein RecX [Gammaproteobacteria bacterium]
MADPADAQGARLYAVSLLARRDFGPRELLERLARRGFTAGTAAEVLAELSASGVLNVARYAENYVSYHAARGQGPLRIASELRQRGVEPELIEQVLAGPEWRQLAQQTVRSRFGSQPPGNWRERARRARFLQYRGFSADHIRFATGADPDLD